MRSLFEISTRGMLSARTATEVASNNIANASTPGFSRRVPVISENVQKFGTGSIGLGVNVTTIERMRDRFIDQQINRKEHEIGNFSEKSSVYRLMETAITSSGSAGLDSIIGEFFNAFSDLSTNSQDINLRNSLLSQAEIMTETFRAIDSDLSNLSNQVFDQTNFRIMHVNELLGDIASLNGEIAVTRSANQIDHNALDRQVLALNELAKLVDFDTLVTEAGATEVRIGGIAIVTGQEFQKLRADVDQYSNTFRLRMQNGKLIDAAKGELAANIEMFEKGIPEAKEKLDKLAVAMIDRIDEIHVTGFGLEDTISRSFFDATSTGASNIRVNAAIHENPSHIAVSSIAGESGNNDRALEIISLQDEPFIDGQTIASRMVEFMGLPGNRLNEIDRKLESASAAKDFLVNRQEQLAGVSIDEELGNMIKFQNSFQASARVLDIGRNMFDTLLSIV